MTTNTLKYTQDHPHTAREHLNLSQFVDYYNIINPKSVFVKDSFDLDKESRKQLVMIRIRKHASDIKLKKTGKSNIQHKLLELIRSQSVIKNKSKQINNHSHIKIKKQEESINNQQILDRQESSKRNLNYQPPKTARLTRSVSKRNWINNRSPVVDGKRLVLSQLSNVQNSLPRFSAKDGSRSKLIGLKAARRYQKKAQLKLQQLSPWIHDDDSF